VRRRGAAKATPVRQSDESVLWRIGRNCPAVRPTSLREIVTGQLPKETVRSWRAVASAEAAEDDGKDESPQAQISGDRTALFCQRVEEQHVSPSRAGTMLKTIAEGAKKRKKSLSFLHGSNKSSELSRKKSKISLDAFVAFQLKPRLVSNSIYEKIHFSIRIL
jgi:hypothetical protein